MQALLEQLIAKYQPITKQGNVANYIPELGKVDPELFGVVITDVGGSSYAGGNHDCLFSIQSIVKIMVFSCALIDCPTQKIFKTISIEPTADGFNSIASLEMKNMHKPLNPMINAGAIAVISLVGGATYQEKCKRIIDFMKIISGNEQLAVNRQVYQSERVTGNRNRALAYYMKSTGIIEGDVEELLDVYFQLCAVNVSCHDLAAMGLVLALDGLLPASGRRVMDRKVCRMVKAVMATCGLYDQSGAFAAHVGIPGKSGVGGGILAIVPKRMGIGVFSPALNEKGNSIAGIELLTDLAAQLDLSIY